MEGIGSEEVRAHFNQSKSGELGPGHQVLLHLWTYGSLWEDEFGDMPYAVAWTVFNRLSDDPDEDYEDPLYLRRTVWMLYGDQLKTMKRVEEAITIREDVWDRVRFREQIEAAAQIKVPVVFRPAWISLEWSIERGVSISADSFPGIALSWKHEGPEQWQPLIKWAKATMKELNSVFAK